MVVDSAGGQAVHAERPPGVRVVQDARRRRGTRRPRHLAEPGDRPAPSCADLAEGPAVGSGVRRASPSGTSRRPARDCRHWKKQTAVRAPRHVRRACPGADVAGVLGEVHGRRQLTALARLLHQHPGPPPAQRAGQVGGECAVVAAPRVAGFGVVVDGDDVLLAGPAPQVDRPGPASMKLVVTGRCGVRRTMSAARGRHASELVGGEAREVQHLGGVAHVLRAARRQDLLPGGVALAPEGRAPGLVEGVQGAVPLAQPAPEGGGRLVALVTAVQYSLLMCHMVRAGWPP